MVTTSNDYKGSKPRTAVALGVAAVVVAAGFSAAAMAETFTATATVSSAVTITEDTPFDFGTLVVVQDGTNAPGGVLAASGTFTSNTATGTENLIQIGSPTPGVYSVDAGVTSFVQLQVTFPATATLTQAGAPPGNGTFTVDTFTVGTLAAGTFAGTTTSVAACNTAISGGGDCQFLSNGSGLVTFPMGASIDVASATTSFLDGTYSGTFDLTATFF